MEKAKAKNIGKKGQIDLFYIIAGVFAIAVIIFAVYLMLDKADSTGMFDISQDSKDVYRAGKLSILSMDNIMLFIIIGLSLFVILSSAFVFNHPAFLVIGLVLLAIAMTVAGVISNSWTAFISHGEISAVNSSFPKIDFLMQKLPWYIMILGLMSAIAMVAGYRRMY